MVRTPSLGCIILALAIVATFLLQQQVEWHTDVWDFRLVLPVRCRQHTHPRRNRKRWLRRWAKWRRRSVSVGDAIELKVSSSAPLLCLLSG